MEVKGLAPPEKNSGAATGCKVDEAVLIAGIDRARRLNHGQNSVYCISFLPFDTHCCHTVQL